MPVAYASDAGIAPPKPHDVLPFSLPRAVAGGLSAAESLQAMTSTAARACGMADRKGRIAVGFDADLLAVDGDVKDDPEALARTNTVVRAGTIRPAAAGC